MHTRKWPLPASGPPGYWRVTENQGADGPTPPTEVLTIRLQRRMGDRVGGAGTFLVLGTKPTVDTEPAGESYLSLCRHSFIYKAPQP